MKLPRLFVAATTLAAMIVVTAQAQAHAIPESHAPSGLMNEHVHKTGEWMLGYRYERSEFSDYQAGKNSINAMAVAHAGYSMGATRMTMEMQMLDIMYAPSDRVTLMLMPHYMTMDMQMEALPAQHAMRMDMGDHGSHGSGHAHSVSGWGDTLLSASYLVNGVSTQGVIATLGVLAPTGSVTERNANGEFVHYDMQLGSGTWDALASVTLREQIDLWSYGAQASVIARAESANESGYRLGDKYQASAWGAYRLKEWLSVSTRVGFTHQDDIEGHYNGPHGHSSPMDIQQNYGGRVWDIGLGVNMVSHHGIRLGLEWVAPIDERYNGIQLTRSQSMSLSLSYALH